MSNSDIGWIDKSKVDATLRNLKGRKRNRGGQEDDATDTARANQDEFVDLFGVTKRSPTAAPVDSQSASYIDAKDSPAQQPSAQQPSAQQPSAQKAATQQSSTAQQSPAQQPSAQQVMSPSRATTASDAPPAAPQTPAQQSTPEPRSKTPTAQIGITRDIPDEYTDPAAEAQLSPQGASPASEPTRNVPRDGTATLETTPIQPEEDGQAAASPDLSARFKDAFDVLRSGDVNHPGHRAPQDAQNSGDLALEDTSASSTASASTQDSGDLALHSTGFDNAPAPPADEDLTLQDVEADTPLQHHGAQSQQPQQTYLDDDAVSLPAHDLDVSIQAAPSAITSFGATHDTRDLADDLVFDTSEFGDDKDQFQTKENLTLPDLPELNEDADTQADASAADEQPMPEHAFVPKIHSKILKTVQLRNSPDPTNFETLYAWLQAVQTWVSATETSSTKFFVADHAGLSLLDTDVDEDTVALAIATRRSMAELQNRDTQDASGYTMFRHQEDAYMNLVWAPSPHGIITIGILSDHVYPDDRLALVEERLARGIDTLPFV